MILVSGLLSVVWLGFCGVESNPGLFMCYIGVLPLSYTPNSEGQCSVVLKLICVTKTCCPSLCCLPAYKTEFFIKIQSVGTRVMAQ